MIGAGVPAMIQRHAIRLLSVLALATSSTTVLADAPRYRAASYDTRYASSATLAALKRDVTRGFWIETGDALLVAAPSTVHDALRKQADVVAEHGELASDELVLAPIGCSDTHGHDLDTVMPVPLAVIGHHALLALPPAVAKRWTDGKPVAANSALASEYRDGAAKGGVDPVLEAAADLVDTTRWFARVGTLATYDRSTFGTTDPGNPNFPTQIGAARDWIRSQFEGLGIATHYENFNIDLVPPTPSQRQNVVAVLPGLVHPDEWVLVGGHYDSRNQCNQSTGCGNPAANSPGAEDNATGCAGVIEMAEIFTRMRPDRTMLFICYAGEEQGLKGSNSHAAALVTSGDISRLKLVVIMDMIGYSGDVDFDLMIESFPAHPALLSEFASLAATYAPGSRTVTSTSACCSDHVGYLNRNVPAVLTIENDWSPTFSPGYQQYHTTNDLPANITNAHSMASKILRTNAAALARYGIITSRVFVDGFE
jgi:hypothetical protein